VAWKDVVRAAKVVRDTLAAIGLESFVKTTGGKGLHVVAPLAPRAGWSECLAFARSVAEMIARTHPAAYTIEFAKTGRAGKILIDYLRNNRTNTSVSAYSTRARSHAPISVPLSWEELGPSLKPESFTVRTLHRRLARLGGDPWAGYWKSRQSLTQRMMKTIEARP
jgi:bifunctional non-homologous end joining protein LigD